jgi:hypothetical protein
MKTKLAGVLILVCCVVLCGGAAMAHHGISVSYQLDKTMTISGTVTGFSFSNPHPQMSLDVKDAAGHIEHWTTEWITSPGRLKRVSGDWNRNRIKPGDMATVVCSPRKTPGTNDCLMRELTINGEKMKISEETPKN